MTLCRGLERRNSWGWAWEEEEECNKKASDDDDDDGEPLNSHVVWEVYKNDMGGDRSF